MTVELALQLVQTAAVVIGIVFGLAQLRQIREQREVQAGMELLDPLHASQTSETLLLLHDLPDGLDAAAFKQRIGDRLGMVLATMSYFECLGPVVARGHVPIDMYAEFYRGPTVLVWRKTAGYVREQRAAGWPSLYEWLQWLAEHMEERVSSEDRPAFERFRNWRRPADYRRLSR